MGLILALLTIIVFIAILAWICSDKGDKCAHVVISTIVCLIVISVIMAFTWGVSYYNYLSLKQRLVTIEQYRSAVDMYSDKGVLEFKKHETGNLLGRIGDLTDLKYHNYQIEMSKKIEKLKLVTVNYNNALIGKRTMKANWFWNWCIIAADSDMEPLKMVKSTWVRFTTVKPILPPSAGE